jgi:hypothetical protein
MGQSARRVPVCDWRNTAIALKYRRQGFSA